MSEWWVTEGSGTLHVTTTEPSEPPEPKPPPQRRRMCQCDGCEEEGCDGIDCSPGRCDEHDCEQCRRKHTQRYGYDQHQLISCCGYCPNCEEHYETSGYGRCRRCGHCSECDHYC